MTGVTGVPSFFKQKFVTGTKQYLKLSENLISKRQFPRTSPSQGTLSGRKFIKAHRTLKVLRFSCIQHCREEGMFMAPEGATRSHVVPLGFERNTFCLLLLQINIEVVLEVERCRKYCAIGTNEGNQRNKIA